MAPQRARARAARTAERRAEQSTESSPEVAGRARPGTRAARPGRPGRGRCEQQQPQHEQADQRARGHLQLLGPPLRRQPRRRLGALALQVHVAGVEAGALGVGLQRVGVDVRLRERLRPAEVRLGPVGPATDGLVSVGQSTLRQAELEKRERAVGVERSITGRDRQRLRVPLHRVDKVADGHARVAGLLCGLGRRHSRQEVRAGMELRSESQVSKYTAGSHS